MGIHVRGLSAREVSVALGLVLAVNLLGAMPAVFVGSDTGWIDRPSFHPPEILFPVVWTLLFTLMGLALFVVWRRGTPGRDQSVAFAAFGLQFALNLAWTPIFFGLQRPGAGLAVIVALWFAIVATIAAFDRISRLAAGLLVPYLLWVSFALVLNYAIYVASG